MNALASITLTADQQTALYEIEAAWEPGTRYSLTGDAGTGKTTLVQRIVRRALDRKQSVALTASTHKAAAVLARKVAEAGMPIDVRTIDSLLGLRAKVNTDRLEFVRPKDAEPIAADLVVVDEASMLGQERMAHIRRHLPSSFVLMVGDLGQLPPVGEERSQAFDTRKKSNLTTIVRQAEGNPIIAAARLLRECQASRKMDWSWTNPVRVGDIGVFHPRDAEEWMQKAFTSPDYDASPDSFRYLAWTNERVAEINRRVRRWRYGDNIPTPFMPGERGMFRKPVVVGETIQFNTSEEATVLEIARDTYRYLAPSTKRHEPWTAAIPAWRILMVRADLTEQTVYAPADDQAYRQVEARLTAEAQESDKRRWNHLHQFKSGMANLQPVYALTTHNSQGSSFRFAFVDVPNIERRLRSNPLECLQLFYVAATRPTNGLVLVGR